MQRKINTKNCCNLSIGILLLESSRGVNSHQSETNLTKTPEALPGAPQKTRNSKNQEFRTQEGIEEKPGSGCSRVWF